MKLKVKSENLKVDLVIEYKKCHTAEVWHSWVMILVCRN